MHPNHTWSHILYKRNQPVSLVIGKATIGAGSYYLCAWGLDEQVRANLVLWANRCPGWESSCVSMNVCISDLKITFSASIYPVDTICCIHVYVYLKRFKFLEIKNIKIFLVNQEFHDPPAVPLWTPCWGPLPYTNMCLCMLLGQLALIGSHFSSICQYVTQWENKHVFTQNKKYLNAYTDQI